MKKAFSTTMFSASLLLSIAVGCSAEKESIEKNPIEAKAEVREKASAIENKTVESQKTEEHNIEITDKDFSLGEISLQAWEKDINLQERLGEPKEENVKELNGDGYTGSIVKTLKYDGLELVLFSPDGESYWIMEMAISSDQFETHRGIKIGDTLDALKKAYPSISLAEDGQSVENNGDYQISNTEKFLHFTVENGAVTSIHFKYELQ